MAPDRIVLPAFPRDAAGCDVVAGRLPEEWRAIAWGCMASTGRDLLDLGPLATLPDRMRAS